MEEVGIPINLWKWYHLVVRGATHYSQGSISWMKSNYNGTSPLYRSSGGGKDIVISFDRRLRVKVWYRQCVNHLLSRGLAESCRCLDSLQT